MLKVLLNIFQKLLEVIVTDSHGSSPTEVFFGKGVLEMCSRFTGENPFKNVISIKLLCKFIEATLRHGCSPVNLLHIFRTPFYKNTSGGLLLLAVIPIFTLREKRIFPSIIS